jgi:GT2 family glycosyltransferase
MYGEDHLWCYQFHKLGYDSYFYAGTEVIHIHAASTHPEQQLKILKKTIALELDIMAYRKGKGIYYALFYLIFAGKENLRYYIKVMLKKYLNIQLR